MTKDKSESLYPRDNAERVRLWNEKRKQLKDNSFATFPLYYYKFEGKS